MTPRLLVLLSMLSAFLPLVTDGFLAAIRPMMAELGVTVGEAQLTISLALAGFAAAQLFVGALADRFGRRPVLLAAMTLLMLASIGVGLAPNFAVVLLCRALQGIAAAAGPVLARAIVRDLCDRLEGARALSLVGMGLAVVPLTVPAVNGLVVARFGWRATLVTTVAFLALPIALTLRDYRETLAARDPLALSPAALRTAAATLVRHGESLGYLLSCVLGYGGLLTWVSASPHLLLGYFHVPPDRFGLYFGIPIVLYAVGGFAGARALRHFPSARILAGGAAAMLAGSGGLILWQLATGQGLTFFMAGVATYNFGWAVLQPHAQAGILAGHLERAGRISAILGFLQMLGGAAVGLAFGWLYDGTPRAAIGLIAAAAVGVNLARWLLVAPAARHDPNDAEPT